MNICIIYIIIKRKDLDSWLGLDHVGWNMNTRAGHYYWLVGSWRGWLCLIGRTILFIYRNYIGNCSPLRAQTNMWSCLDNINYSLRNGQRTTNQQPCSLSDLTFPPFDWIMVAKRALISACVIYINAEE